MKNYQLTLPGLWPGFRVKQVAFRQTSEGPFWEDSVKGTVLARLVTGTGVRCYIAWDNAYGDGWYDENGLNRLRP